MIANYRITLIIGLIFCVMLLALNKGFINFLPNKQHHSQILQPQEKIQASQTQKDQMLELERPINTKTLIVENNNVIQPGNNIQAVVPDTPYTRQDMVAKAESMRGKHSVSARFNEATEVEKSSNGIYKLEEPLQPYSIAASQQETDLVLYFSYIGISVNDEAPVITLSGPTGRYSPEITVVENGLFVTIESNKNLIGNHLLDVNYSPQHHMSKQRYLLKFY